MYRLAIQICRLAKLGLALIIASWPTYSFSQSLDLVPKEQAPLFAIMQRIDKFERMAASFVQQNHIAALQAPLTSKGEVYVDAQLGIAWYVSEPLRSKLIISDLGIDTGEGLVAASRTIAQLLRAVITGDIQALSNLFSITSAATAHLASDLTPNLTPNPWMLELLPKNEALRSRILSMQLQGSNSINQLEVMQPGGNRIVITFTDPRPLNTLPDWVNADLEPSNQ